MGRPAHPDGLSLHLMLPDQMVESSLKNTWSLNRLKRMLLHGLGKQNTVILMSVNDFTSHAYDAINAKQSLRSYKVRKEGPLNIFD